MSLPECALDCPGWLSFPALIVGLSLVSEAFAWLMRKRLAERGRTMLRLYLWTIRPWFAWSLVNIIFRCFAEHGFNEPETFPFYADPWEPELSVLSRLGRLATQPAFMLCLASALAVLGAMCWLGARLLDRSAKNDRAPAWGPPALCALTLAFSLAVNSLPSGWASAGSEEGSFVRSWRNPSATLLPAVRKIAGTQEHLRRFLEYQDRLGVHGHSHPPGAALLLYWIGRAAALGRPPTIHHYAVGMASVAALNGLLIYLLGSRLSSPSIGIGALLLWALSPATAIYSVFAQESIYALFFNASLLGIWMVASSRRHVRWSIALGCLFFCLSMINYSWSVVAAMFALFLLLNRRLKKESFAVIARRGLTPMIVFAALFTSFLLVFDLDYLTMYRNAYQYVMQFYQLRGPYQHTMALFGGQLGVLLMMGSLCASAFLVALFYRNGDEQGASARAFLVSVLLIYCIPLLLVPAVRIEAPRQWNWIASLPVVFAAAFLWDEPRRRKAPLLTAACVSGLTSIAMRIFIVFWG